MSCREWTVWRPWPGRVVLRLEGGVHGEDHRPGDGDDGVPGPGTPSGDIPREVGGGVTDADEISHKNFNQKYNLFAKKVLKNPKILVGTGMKGSPPFSRKLKPHKDEPCND